MCLKIPRYHLNVLVVAFACLTQLQAANVTFSSLATTRLPYGEGITISGQVEDFHAADKQLGTVAIADWIAIKKLTVTVTVEGSDPRPAVEAKIDGSVWQISFDKFPKNASLHFVFSMTGELKAEKADQVIDALLNDTAFAAALTSFHSAASRADPDVAAKGRDGFAMAAGPLISKALPAFLQPADNKTVADVLKGSQPITLGVINVPDNLANLRGQLQANSYSSLNGFKASMPPSEAYKVLEHVTDAGQVRAIQANEKEAELTANRRDGLFDTINVFVADYRKARGFGASLLASLPLQRSVNGDSTVADFEKYAGIDLGAIYVPRVQSLRGYFTVNVYLGSVEDSPAPVTPCVAGVRSSSRRSKKDAVEVEKHDVASGKKLAAAATPTGRACTWRDSVAWQVFQQRFSITGGMSIGDLSGQQNSIMKDDYGFLIGIGWRINKYFRITAGDFLFRDKNSDRIGHGIFAGPSIDFSAIGNLTGIFGKVK